MGANNIATIKTIYDPSPISFTLPRTAAFTNFTSSGNNTSNGGEFNVSGSFTKGWNFYVNGWRTGNTIFFHALGFRESNIISYGDDGHYWTTGVSSESKGCYLTFVSAAIHPVNLNDNRSYGNTVRSVKE